MEFNKLVGIIILLVLVLSVALVGFSAVNSTLNKDKGVIQTEQKLDESELNQSLMEDTENGTLSTINIHFNQDTGGMKIKFADNVTEIYKVASRGKTNYTTDVSASQDGDQLDVNINSNCSDNTLILSNKYDYNINGEIVAGGLTVDLNNNSRVNDLSTNLTAGGLDLKLSGGTLNTSHIKINTGGLNIIGQPSGVTKMNAEIEVGGLNLQLKKSVADIFSDIRVGGINPGNYQKVSDNEFKGAEFDSSQDKLIINNTIKVGGVNTQKYSS